MARSLGTTIMVDAAKSVLSGNGFLPDKSGRMWYEDHGWFVLLVDFQAPVGWQGSFLNVGASFLWRPDTGSGVYCAFDFGGRIGNNRNEDGTTITYADDQVVYREQADRLARRGLEEGVKLRELDDWAAAKRLLLPHVFTSDALWGNWHRAMLCFCTWDSRAAEYFNSFSVSYPVAGQPQSVVNAELVQFVADQTATFGPLVGDYDACQRRIRDTVLSNRQAFRDQGFSGLDPEWEFVMPPQGSVPEEPLPPQPSFWKKLVGRKRR